MNHGYIEEHEVVERYLLGQLAPEEAESFEEHYLSCQECLDRLELTESMERGFKRAAGQDAAAAVRQLAAATWFSRLGRARQAATLLMGVFVLLVVPGGLTLLQFGHLDRELADARKALAREREAATGRGSEAAALSSDLAASRGELERERQAHARVEELLAEAGKPQGNLRIYDLDGERGAAGEPTAQVRRTPGVIFRLAIDPPHPPSYLAVVRDSRGREVTRLTGLQSDESDTLTLRLGSDPLAPGDYTITISAGGKPVPGGRFAFRVLPP